MAKSRKSAVHKPPISGRELEPALAPAGLIGRVEHYRKRQVIYTQGDLARDVRYLLKGTVKLSVLSSTGKEGVIGMLSEGDFFGEGIMVGQTIRITTATATAACSVMLIDRDPMTRLLRDEPAVAVRFLSHMLARNIRIEADLVDQLFNSSEKRLARTLLLLARYGQPNSVSCMPRISQETLAEMIGTTRPRVNFFMNKFKKLGFIEYNGVLKINSSLLSVVLHD